VYEGETSNDILIACATQPPPSLASVVQGAPAGVVDVVDRALSVDKDQRWENASRMQAAIRKLLENEADLGENFPTAGPTVETPSTLSETDGPSIVSRFADVAPRARTKSGSLQRAAVPLLVAAAIATLGLVFAYRQSPAAERDSNGAQPSQEAGAIEMLVATEPSRTLSPELTAAAVPTTAAAGAAPLAAPPAGESVSKARKPSAVLNSPPQRTSESQDRPARSDTPAGPDRGDDFEDPVLDRRK
jgi:hypothetical protein